MKQSKTKSMSIFFLVILLIASFGLAAIKGLMSVQRHSEM